jgi:hypothetical protein
MLEEKKPKHGDGISRRLNQPNLSVNSQKIFSTHTHAQRKIAFQTAESF